MVSRTASLSSSTVYDLGYTAVFTVSHKRESKRDKSANRVGHAIDPFVPTPEVGCV